MLNGFKPERGCVVCGKLLQMISNQMESYGVCGSIPYKWDKTHYIISSGLCEGTITYNYESIVIDNYLLQFSKDNFKILELDKETYNSIIKKTDFGKSNLKFNDVNTVEKIENVIKNYQILC